MAQPRPQDTVDQAGEPDDTGCHILHIDMDAFYASVEIRDRQQIAAQPVIVGHTGGRGVVLSANYIARGFGVRSAMPISRAQRLCPHAVFVAPRHGVYTAVSREVRDELGITCSVGIASTKFVAKLASVRCKPDGLLVIPADRVLDFLHPLP